MTDQAPALEGGRPPDPPVGPAAHPPTHRGSERERLGDLLVTNGTITEGELQTALEEQQTQDGTRRRLGIVLRDLGLADDRDIALALGSQLDLRVVTGAALHAAPKAAVELVPRRLATHYDLIPLDVDRETGKLTIAIADPTNVVAIDDLRSLPGVRTVTLRVAPASAIARARSLLYERGVADATVQEMHAAAVDDHSADEFDDDDDDEPVIRLVNLLLSDAIRSRASDIHVEPQRDGMRVRYRVDGLLREVQHIPRQMAAAVTSRLKVMSALDIAERRRPQDGRSSIKVDGDEVDMRVSTMPSLHGETTVMRLLRKGAQRLDVDDLGFDEDQRRDFERAVGRSQGLIVMTGPTGSGKTTTLYAGLGHLSDPTRNVITLEDPIEYELDGINQTQVNARIGMTFATGLRSVLRQDPDVVMVGEVRDAETAALAVEASFTGHLVLSTLHTNDAPSTVVRLAELGVERFLIGTTLLMVVAQRLTRRVCDACAYDSGPPDAETLELLGLTAQDVAGGAFRAGEGCVECESTGFLGRVGVYEILRITPRMRQLIADGGSELQIGALARAEGMRSLRQDGIGKAMAGVTTLTEVLRITPEDQFQHAGSDDHRRTALRVGAIEARRAVVLGAGMVDELERALPDEWTVAAADDVEDAVRHTRDEDPDVVVVEEVDDPGRTDVLLRRLREDEHDQRPVVVRSRRALDPARVRSLLALGTSDVVHGDTAADDVAGVLIAAIAAR